MDHVAFSSALYALVCYDLSLDQVPVDTRFGNGLDAWLDPFTGDSRVFAKHALLRSLFKKSEVEEHPDSEMETLQKFHAANNACLGWKLDPTEDLAVGYSISYAKALLADWFEPFSGTELVATQGSIESRARFGPGQSVGHGKRPTHYYFKVGDAPMTAGSPFVRSWYSLSTQHNPLCEAAELARKARHGEIELASSGQLSLVPKSYLSKRVVVTEPSCNVYFQLGLGDVIVDVLRKRVGLDLSNQQCINAEMARQGSIDGSYATMDLKQCSDYIALGLAKYMLPRSLFQWVSILRTRSVTWDGEVFPLGMVSTMGCGFTFPLQTVLLASLLLGVYKTLDIDILRPSKGLPGNFGVYGDDIIVAQKAYRLLHRTLTTLGLVINDDKSFCEGPFRESCGSDWFAGREVRGVYIRKYGELSTHKLQDFYSIFNRLAIWSAKQSILLPNTLAFLRRIIGEDNFHFVPPDEGVTAGIISPVPPGPESPLGLWRYKCLIPIANSFRVDLWEAYQADEGKKTDVTMRLWLQRVLDFTDGTYNEPAMVKALLYGAIRRGKIAFRQGDEGDVFTYRTVWRKTPRWGFSNNELISTMDEISRDRWMRSITCHMNVTVKAP